MNKKTNKMEIIKITEGNEGSKSSFRKSYIDICRKLRLINTWFKRQSERAMLEENIDFGGFAILQTL
jgi:hypothetical protein